MKVYYLSSDNLEKFREKIEENISQYRDGKLKFVEANDLVRAPKLEIKDFDFDMSKSKPSDTDYENIKRLYLAFKDLKDSQATEESLWAGLCHYSPFWEYLKYRWESESEKNVLDRYFFGEANRSKFYNGLARLWWYGRMTYDEGAKDPFELTKYICEENMTLKGLLPMTFAFSHNKKIYKTYIRTLMNFEKKSKLTQREHERIRRRVNIWGGKILLDSLSDEELGKKITDYLNKLTKEREDKFNKEKECPVCNKKAEGKVEIEKYFGWRKSNGKKILQSYCKKCRASKKKN